MRNSRVDPAEHRQNKGSGLPRTTLGLGNHILWAGVERKFNPCLKHMIKVLECTMNAIQCFMQDQNVACHDLGKVSCERAVGCFGKPQLERATRFPMPQLERATRFPMSQLERATRFPNVPSRARDSLLNCQFKVCVFDCFCHSMPFICLNITSINYIN